jgi:imidazolonepropionase-like amidohydrolase
VIEGCREGWTVASEHGRAGAFAVVTPRTRRDKTENLVRPGGSSIENAAILHEHGVQVAVVPGTKGIDLGGIVGRDIMHLTIEAGFAVRGGLSDQAALESITIVPARILGVDHRVGSIEVGKDCDLILTDGDLLHYQTFVQYAVVEGETVYDKQEELYFAHIRPRPVAEVAPEERVDPGEEETDEEEGAASADEPEEDGR